MQAEKTTLLAAVEKLRELDRKFKSGSDLDVVEKGYAHKLVDAIVSDDEVLECEALKGLGDLYLHKAKIYKHKVDNFNKACALYTELLQHCSDDEKKQVVQHRIRYAEKCTKLVHSQTCAKSEIETPANITLDVAKTLEVVKKSTKIKGHGAMPLLVEGYTKTFVNSIVDRNRCLQVESLKSLGDLYLEKGRVGRDEAAFKKATGLYQRALKRCDDIDGRATLKHRIKYAAKVQEERKKRQRSKSGLSKARKAGSDTRSVSLLTSRLSALGVRSQRNEGRKKDRESNTVLANISDTPQGDTDSIYKKHLQEGCMALQARDLDMAEQNFAAALKSVHVKESSTDQHWKETEPLLRLSKVYLIRGMQSKDGGDFTKAAALSQAALVRSRGEHDESIRQTILEINQSFIRLVLGSEQTVDLSDAEKHKLLLREHRDYVEKEIKKMDEQADPYSLDENDPKIREVEKQRVEAVKALFDAIAHERKTFITNLVEECMGVMGPPPCKYAMIGLGSQATGLVTPYSDLEFAILIEDETDNNVKYFRNLTHHLHLKVINLGETILPAMGIKSLNDFFSDNPLDDWFYDSGTPRGFAFDGAMPNACKTPLGRGKNTPTVTQELIQTPSKMTNVLKDDLMYHLKKRYHLAGVLGNVCLITGEQDLVDEYNALWTRQLQENSGIKSLLLAISMLSENSPMFQIQPLTARMLNIKKEIYRFASLAVSCWAMLNGIQPSTIWETIQKLNKNGVINSENTHHLMVLVGISAELRLRTYMGNRGQVENMSALLSMSRDVDTGNAVKLEKVFYFSNANQLLRYYYTAMPLKQFMSQLNDSQVLEEPPILFDNSSGLQADVYESLCNYQKSKECSEQALRNDLAKYGKNTAHSNIALSLNNLGAAWSNIGDHAKAVEYFEKALRMRRHIFGENTAHDDIAASLNNLGSSWSSLGDHKKAASYYQQSLQMGRSIYGEGTVHPDIASLLNSLGNSWKDLGDHKKANSYFEQSLQMNRDFYGEDATHSDIAMPLHNLGNLWRSLGDYKKAVSYYEKSLKMERSIYGDSTIHPCIAQTLTNLGNVWGELGDFRKAYRYYEQSLRMMLCIYGEDSSHPDIALILNNLGNAWRDLGNHKKAIGYYEQSLQMMWDISGKSSVHPDIARTLSNLGSTWGNLGHHEKAIRYYEQSLQMARRINGEGTSHADIARLVDNLGGAWRNLSDYNKAVENHEKALQMRQNIYGKDNPHPDIAMSLNNLGATWADLGDHRKAVDYYEEALQIMRTIYGENTAHPSIVLTLDNLVRKQSYENNNSTATEQGVIMLQVSETMLSAEERFQKEFFLLVELYEESLASAIRNNDTLLEVEILKGIGDANLEKGKVSKDTAVLADADIFYRGALSRCEDPDGKEALLHRIRYAGKIKERIFDKQAKDASSGQPGTKTAKTMTSLSTVAEEFRELDLILDSGCDLDDVEKGYARMLIQAVSCQSELLEREALKSLGDLYLQQSKTMDHKVEAFNKACELYREGMRCCKDEEEKQVLQHRIKYAEKCTRLVHNKEGTKPEVELTSANITLDVAKPVHSKNDEKTEGMKTSANITLNVATTLQALTENIQMKAHGAMPLIEGYTNCFFNAVVERDERLQTESLKSLGDLYLEKGEVGKDEAALTKAAGLYQGALKRCDDSDGREALKHRIKKDREKECPGAKMLLAKLLVTSVGKPKPGSVNVIKGTSRHVTTITGSSDEVQEDTDSIYKEHLQKGCRALQTGDLDKAEKNIAAALKSVHIKDPKTGDSWKEAETLYKLSEVYLKRGIRSKDGGDFTKAAALCNAALVRSREEDNEGIIRTIREITQSFVKHVLSSDETIDIDDVEKHKLVLRENRAYVEKEVGRIEEQVNPYCLDEEDLKTREVEKDRAEAIKELFQTIVQKRRTFITDLVDECVKVTGPPPCKYAMIGLGSQATGLVTPYSDLEFAILIEEETGSNVDYFRDLTHFLHLKVINLGETILPAMVIKSLNDFWSDDPLDNWYYDSVTPRGFAFDGAMPKACKTPLGTGTSLLIRTPAKMAELLKDDLTLHLKKGYHLANILGNVCLITGEQALMEEYTALWTQQLQQHDGTIPSLIAKNTLTASENAPMFQINAPTASLLNVKKEMYRFASVAMESLALLHGIQPTTIWETIQRLKDNAVINDTNAHHMMVMVSISAELRLRTYIHNRSQAENMSALSSMSTDTDIAETVKKVFYVSNTKQLMRYYYTSIPLKLFISQLVNKQPPEESPVLFLNSLRLKADVFENLCDYQKSKTCQERALQNDLAKQEESAMRPYIAHSLKKLGTTWMNLGDHRKAVNYYEQELQMRFSINGEDTAHQDIAQSLDNLGNAWAGLGDHRKAISYHEQSLQMKRSIHGVDTSHSDIAKSLNCLGTVWRDLGDPRKAIGYHEQSLQMKRNVYGEDTEHLDVANSLNNLGVAWRDLGDHRKAINYHQQSLLMRQSIYGDTTAHPDIATSLGNLGIAWRDLGDYKKAITYYVKSLQMRVSVYGENAHPDIASSFNNLGTAKEELGDHKKAIFYYEHALQMRLSIYGESSAHPDIASSLMNLGNAHGELGDYKKAVGYYEQSLQMSLSILGESTAHPETAGLLHNLGVAWGNLGDYPKSVNFHKQALQMMRSLYGESALHPDIARSLSSLGTAWNGLGDYRKAITYHECSLQMLLSIYGVVHPQVAHALNNLGNAWGKLGDHRKAVSYLKLALQMKLSLCGENTTHPDVAQSLSNLGATCLNLGDYRMAVNHFEQSLQMGKYIYGKNTAHPDIADLLTNLGTAWGMLGDPRKAISYYEQSLEMNRTIYGGNVAQPSIAHILNNLGNTWRDMGDHKKAVSCFEQSLQISQTVYGENTSHPDIAAAHNNLGNAWLGLGDNKKAISYYEESLEMRRELYGESSADSNIAHSLNNLGIAWKNLGDHRKAVAYYNQSLKMRLSVYGKTNAHPDIAASLNNLGTVWRDLGDYRKAASYYEQSIQMQRSIYGENTAHLSMAISLNNLSNVWSRLGDQEKANDYQTQSLMMRRCIYGENAASLTSPRH
ncbi:uncharacterized protein LOC144861607 [Branchiostoma floridae x Branchiostoma japonicum]